MNGPVGLSFAVGMGVNHVMNINGARVMNMIPVDICVKGMIIASHKVWLDLLEGPIVIPVYNSASMKCISYEAIAYEIDIAKKYPSKNIVGIPGITFAKCWYYAWILRIFRHFIPALILDGLLVVSGNKPRLKFQFIVSGKV